MGGEWHIGRMENAISRSSEQGSDFRTWRKDKKEKLESRRKRKKEDDDF